MLGARCASRRQQVLGAFAEHPVIGAVELGMRDVSSGRSVSWWMTISGARRRQRAERGAVIHIADDGLGAKLLSRSSSAGERVIPATWWPWAQAADDDGCR